MNSLTKNLIKLTKKSELIVFQKQQYSNVLKISQNLNIKAISVKNNISFQQNFRNQYQISSSSTSDIVKKIRERKDFSEPNIPMEELKGIQSMQKQVHQCVSYGAYKEALDQSKIYADKIAKYYENTHPAYFSAMNNTALILKMMGQFMESKEIYEQVLEGYTELFGPSHGSTLTVRLNLANLKIQQGSFQNALLDLQEVLAYRVGEHFMELKNEDEEDIKYKNYQLEEIEQILNNNIPLCLIPMSNCYRELKEYEKSINLSKKTLKLLKTKYSDQNVLVATVYNNMGLTYKRSKDLDNSEVNYLMALKIRQSILAGDHPDIIATKHNLGELYLAKGETQKGQAYIEENLKVMKPKK